MFKARANSNDRCIKPSSGLLIYILFVYKLGYHTRQQSGKFVTFTIQTLTFSHTLYQPSAVSVLCIQDMYVCACVYICVCWGGGGGGKCVWHVVYSTTMLSDMGYMD